MLCNWARRFEGGGSCTMQTKPQPTAWGQPVSEVVGQLRPFDTVTDGYASRPFVCRLLAM